MWTHNYGQQRSWTNFQTQNWLKIKTTWPKKWSTSWIQMNLFGVFLSLLIIVGPWGTMYGYFVWWWSVANHIGQNWTLLDQMLFWTILSQFLTCFVGTFLWIFSLFIRPFRILLNHLVPFAVFCIILDHFKYFFLEMVAYFKPYFFPAGGHI